MSDSKKPIAAFGIIGHGGWGEAWIAAAQKAATESGKTYTVTAMGSSFGWSSEEWPEWAIRAVEGYRARGWTVRAGRYGFSARPPEMEPDTA